MASTVLDAVDMVKVRRKGIGGTDIAAILGMNPWKTAHDVWLDKMSLSEYVQSEAAKWGLLLEPLIAQEYAKRLGVKVYQPNPRFVRHPKVEIALGALDYVQDGAPVGLECKMSSQAYADEWGEEGTDQVPDATLIQAQWYLGITGYARWDVALLMGYQLRVYSLTPNPDLWSLMLEAAQRFWAQFVLTKTMPPVDYSKGARTMLETVYPHEQAAVRAATEEESRMAMIYLDHETQIEAHERDQLAIRNLLCERIGTAAGIQGPWGKVTWKRTKDGTKTDWEAVAKALWNEAALVKPGGPWGREVWDEAVRAHSTPQPGVRRFLPTFRAKS